MVITAINKSDLRPKAARLSETEGNAVFEISAQTGEKVSELAAEVFTRLSNLAVTVSERQVALDLRGREILELTLVCLRQARQDTAILRQKETVLGVETVVTGVQQALHTVGGILGKDVTEDVLETIFSRFCIGK